MGWNTPRRPKISNKLGIPTPREGGDGDMQVRQTSIGARLFSKLGGRWLHSPLEDQNTILKGAVYNVKSWSIHGTFPDPMVTTPLLGLLNTPKYINEDNILSISAMIKGLAAPNDWMFFKLGGAPAEHAGSGDAFEDRDIEIHWDAALNRIEIKSNSAADDLDGKEFKVTVFFK